MTEPADQALARAWELSVGDSSDAVEDELETLIPALVEAEYAETDGYKWNFTPKGIKRIDELGLDDEDEQPAKPFTRDDFMRDLRKVTESGE
jgi:hypothetical protein